MDRGHRLTKGQSQPSTPRGARVEDSTPHPSRSRTPPAYPPRSTTRRLLPTSRPLIVPVECLRTPFDTSHLMRLRLGPPRWWVRTSMINLVLAKLPQVPAVMIDRPPPPAAPMSGHHRGRPCHLNVAGQTHVCKSWSGQTQR
jgi:hypothetical protein